MLRRTTVAVAAAALVSAVLAPVSGAHASEVPTQASTNTLVAAEKASIQRRYVAAAAAQAAAVQVQGVAGTYTVVPNDTLSGIAGRYSTTWENLYGLNTNVIKNPHLIYPKQVLTVTGTASRQAPAAQPAAPAPVAASSGWVNPVCADSIGDNIDPGYRSHKGIDLEAPYGRPIRAAAAGTVRTGWQSGAGNYTVVDHGGGVATAYLHQQSFAVQSGWVEAGQVIGYVGSTGDSRGPHLHFEVWTGGYWVGKYVNPARWLNDRGARLGC